MWSHAAAAAAGLKPADFVTTEALEVRTWLLLLRARVVRRLHMFSAVSFGADVEQVTANCGT